MKRLILLILMVWLGACADNQSTYKTNTITLPATPWRFSLDLNGSILPFNGTFSNVRKNSAKLTLTNHDEEIIIDNVALRNDSVIVTLPYFNTEMRLRVESPYMMSGSWVKLDREDYSIPLDAEQGAEYRFTNTSSNLNIANQYAVRFDLGKKSEYPAVLIINNNQGKLTGTILTETGDYRYLEGDIMNEQVNLSTFDGSHAFLFTADINGDSLVNGVFKSGKNYTSRWCAVADSAASLKRPDQITKTDSTTPFNFFLPNQNGDTVSWDNLNLHNKVVILELMGTWCPNCMDASNALSSLKEPYSDEELVIIPVLFEYKNDIEFANIAYNRYRERIKNMPEYFLLGGNASKMVAQEKFPMLSTVRSFPTLIFIDKHRKVREVYTGFYGPGTGTYYNQFMQSKRKLLAQLVSE
ncbi:MAG: redoxin domain-containing protein [Flavobacteriales bacterium]|nr:redoxin domain-containing protein [Flavobacteriales bacterium]